MGDLIDSESHFGNSEYSRKANITLCRSLYFFLDIRFVPNSYLRFELLSESLWKGSSFHLPYKFFLKRAQPCEHACVSRSRHVSPPLINAKAVTQLRRYVTGCSFTPFPPQDAGTRPENKFMTCVMSPAHRFPLTAPPVVFHFTLRQRKQVSGIRFVK